MITNASIAILHSPLKKQSSYLMSALPKLITSLCHYAR